MLTSSLRADTYDDATAWYPEVEELFDTDHHCSPLVACDVLARHIVRDLHHRDEQSTIVYQLDVRSGHGTAVRLDEIELALQGAFLRASNESLRFVRGSTPADATNEDVLIIEAKVDAAVDSTDNGLDGGTLRVKTYWAGETSVLTARFVNKMWVAQVQPIKDLVCVRSMVGDGLISTSNAMTNVVDQELMPRLLQSPYLSRITDSQRTRARQIVIDHVESSPIVRDRFRQEFYRSVDGERHVAIAREAVLIDVSEQQLEPMAKQVANQLRRVERRQRSVFFLGTIGMALTAIVGCVGYKVLNAVTKGYFVWPIRFATFVFLLLSTGITATVMTALLKGR